MHSRNRKVRSTPMNNIISLAGVCIRVNGTVVPMAPTTHAATLTASCFIDRARVCACPNFSFRDGSNTRSTCRFRALITPIRADMVGPPRSAPSISHRRDRSLVPVQVRPDVGTIEAPTVHARGFLLALKPWTLDLRVTPLAALSSAISFKADVSSAQVAMLCRSAYTIH